MKRANQFEAQNRCSSLQVPANASVKQAQSRSCPGFADRKKRLSLICLFAVSLIFCTCSKPEEFSGNRLRNFDQDWFFFKDSSDGTGQPEFDEAAWRKIDLPHDWSIEDLPGQKENEVVGPFIKNSGGPREGRSTGHVTGGTGWYRKSFKLDPEDANKQIAVYFEGAYMETDVWINGTHAGSHKHGYTSFLVDITRHCKPPGEENILTVRVMNRGQNSRWYSGSGLYRHVKLLVVNPVHIDHWGVYITTRHVGEEAWVKVRTSVSNREAKNAGITIRTRILNIDRRLVSETKSSENIPAHSGLSIADSLKVQDPRLWSPETPDLYSLETTLFENGKILDQTISAFGIRNLHFNAEYGFMLNGRKMELKGGCIHHDNGILGAVAIDRAEERRVELLKANGFNAVRSSHYPPSEKFLEACDRLGLLVIDEAFDMWQKPKNKDDYHQFFDSCREQDFSSMLLRDRNHPSVILWSIGNEIEERADPSGLEITREFKAKARELDPSRLITGAVNEFWDHPGRAWRQTAPAFELLDVGGYNYMWQEYENDHHQFPHRIMVGTESVPFHAFENWQLVEKHPYVIGDFVWTAMDYLGESGIGHAIPETARDEQLMPWPWFNAWCGDIDLAGNKKPQSFFRDVVWRRSKIEMAVHTPMSGGVQEKVSYWGWPDEQQSWTWPGHERQLFEVNVYSRSPVVRLELNGKVIGEQELSEKTNLTAKFKVPYEPGELKAIAVENGTEEGSVSLKTTGQAKKIRLVVDRTDIRADRNDLAYVTVEIVDENGNIVPNSEILVHLIIQGDGELAAAGSANPSCMASFRQPQARTFRGRCLAIVRPVGSPGKILLKAMARGVEPDSVIVRTAHPEHASVNR
ncbi:MAG: glycoside hydrolase family 2 TIM barrel-domain containing protein [Mangrovibacterium sp.]